ncbi:MAG: hypothetical protein JOZ08_07105 [Verrucomicrobia bacterium]|nr:hypothetical protein [Verrucomicrobiota bacterium]MBV8274930.1 hypothetical protein [Verrucomicrobiota bacterium]
MKYDARMEERTATCRIVDAAFGVWRSPMVSGVKTQQMGAADFTLSSTLERQTVNTERQTPKLGTFTAGTRRTKTL